MTLIASVRRAGPAYAELRRAAGLPPLGRQVLTLAKDREGPVKFRLPDGAVYTALLDGEPARFEDLPLDLSGLPPFQRRCLEVLRSTRPGEILTYGELAARAGSPRAARAAGQAMRRNPLPILVPCHRVVGEGWSGGFSFGQGLTTKQRLLDLERP